MTSPFLPQIQKLLPAPQCPDTGPGEFHRVTKGEVAALAPETLGFLLLGQCPPAAHQLPPAQLLEQTELPAMSSGALGGSQAPSSEGMSLEVNPRVLATGGQFGPVFSPSLWKTWQRPCGVVTGHCLGKELEAEPRGSSANDGVYCSLV